jgi:hypothetical protein
MEIKEIVMKLIGAVDPVGETNEDERRYQNLKALVALADELLHEINDVTYCRTRHEWSMARAGKYAFEELGKLADEYSEPSLVFTNDGNSEADHIEHENNACPYCGGSGHKDDVAL